jgi:hypothetical protein
MSPCGKRLETFTLTHYWGLSALHDGLESVGFEVVARIRGGLRVGEGTDLNAKMLVRVGGNDEGRKILWYYCDCVFRRLQMGPGIVDRQSLCCTRRNGHIGSQSQRTGSEIGSQPEAVQASCLFPDHRFWIVSVLPTIRKLARPGNTRAFIGTNATDEPTTSGLPMISPKSSGNGGFV